jgi:hypothetical protein
MAPSLPPFRWWLAATGPGFSLGAVLVLATPAACGSSTDTSASTATAGTGGSGAQTGSGGEAGGPPPEPVVETLHPDADPLPGQSDCTVVIKTGITLAPWKHVEGCAAVEYATNPPSGGDHWPFWAAWQEHADPVPREVYNHNLEHGGIVLSYDCVDACPEVVAALQAAAAGATPDPKCIGFNARTLITADSELDTPIAASAWGATYTATCLDPTSLADFIEDRYAKGPEDTCAQGKVAVDGGFACD